MDTTKFSITERNGKWQILNAYQIPMGGYSFPSQERAQEVLDCLSRGGSMVDGYLIQPDEVQAKSSVISSGLGIGGVGSDDCNIHTETNNSAPQFSKSKSSGQLWQPCAKGGCDIEPVCLNCEYCDEHCNCGE